MQFKAALALSLFAAAQVALAQPPACLLAALKYVSNFRPMVYTGCSNDTNTRQQPTQPRRLQDHLFKGGIDRAEGHPERLLRQ